MSRTYEITDEMDVDLHEVHPGFTGRWLIQVTAYDGLTALTPKLSAGEDRESGTTTYVTRAITPADNSADVATITGTGLWIMESLTGKARLSSTGTGTATVVVQPAIG